MYFKSEDTVTSPHNSKVLFEGKDLLSRAQTGSVCECVCVSVFEGVVLWFPVSLTLYVLSTMLPLRIMRRAAGHR